MKRITRIMIPFSVMVMQGECPARSMEKYPALTEGDRMILGEIHEVPDRI